MLKKVLNIYHYFLLIENIVFNFIVLIYIILNNYTTNYSLYNLFISRHEFKYNCRNMLLNYW